MFPNRRAGDTFVVAMVFFVLAGSFAYLLRTSTLYYYEANSGPLAYARLFYFFHMLAVGFTASFIGQYFLGFALMRRRVVNLFLQVSLLVVAVGVTLQVNTVGSDYSGIGVVVKDVWATGSLALFATIYMSTALAVLLRTLIRNKDPIVRKQTVFMTVGVVAHGVMAETHAISRIFLALYLPPVLTITALTMAACFAFAVWRYQMLVVTPRKEEPVALPRRFDLKAGRGYLFRERRPRLVFLALAESVRHGAIGLLARRRRGAPDARLAGRGGRHGPRRHGGDAHRDHELRTRLVRGRLGRAPSPRARQEDGRDRAESALHPRGRGRRARAGGNAGGDAGLPGASGTAIRPLDVELVRGRQCGCRFASDDEPIVPLTVASKEFTLRRKGHFEEPGSQGRHGCGRGGQDGERTQGDLSPDLRQSGTRRRRERGRRRGRMDPIPVPEESVFGHSAHVDAAARDPVRFVSGVVRCRSGDVPSEEPRERGR